jgi:hypothetical protein
MSLWRSREGVVEAFRLTADDSAADPAWAVRAIRAGRMWFENIGAPDMALVIRNPDRLSRARMGDWVVRTRGGRIYPCKPEIFASNYTPFEPPHRPALSHAA